MNSFDSSVLEQLYKPSSASHKGENGKLLLIGGSKLFHAASLWSLQVASRIVDMVFYASVPENNALVEKAKEEFRNGIVIPRAKIDDYISEVDCVLIGPGLPRESGVEEGDDDTKQLTESLLTKYPDKKWVIDGGSLQVIDAKVLLNLSQMPILTPHQREFENLKILPCPSSGNESREELVELFATAYNCVVLSKGETDIVAGHFKETVAIPGGNAGMTKGGTGDVLAGLTAALYCKNDAFLAACAASYFNKKAGESLFEKVGTNFNSSDLASEIPLIMKNI